MPYQPETSAGPAKISLNWLQILMDVVVGLMVLLGAVSFFYYHYQSKQESFAAEKTPSKIATKPLVLSAVQSVSEVVVDETANWKLFKGSQYWQIKYPLDWSLVGQPDGCGPALFPPERSRAYLTICNALLATDLDTIAQKAVGQNSRIISKEDMIFAGHVAVKVRFETAERFKFQTVIVVKVDDSWGKEVDPQAGALSIFLKSTDQAAEEKLNPVLDTLSFL